MNQALYYEMKTIPLKNDLWRVFVDTDEYRTLLESAYEPQSRTVRQVRLEMRLMACSMRVDTVSDLRRSQFEQHETSEGDHWMCTVQAKDSTDREAETRPRGVFIPDDLMNDIENYADKKSISSDDLLFPISTRTIQRDVTRSAANAATKTGNEDFRKISAHDLRRYFATHLLFRHQVPSMVVQMLGGWKSDEAMSEYLVLPDDVLFERLGEAGLLGTSYDRLGRHDHKEQIAAAVSRLAELLKTADSDTVQDAGTSVGRVFEEIEAITVDVATETTGDADENSDLEQMSFQRMDLDDRSVTYPGETAKIAYYACVVLISWSLTFGPVA